MTQTWYRIAETAGDYAEARKLLGEVTVYPTAMASRQMNDGTWQLIAAMGTQPFEQNGWMVIGGPLVTRLAAPVHVAMRLVELYEAEMKRHGVIAYHFHVDRTNLPMKRVCDRMQVVPYDEGPHGWWYRRVLPGVSDE